MPRIRTALQILALSASTFATACGDGERQLSATANLAEVGGNPSDAGTVSTHAGGNSSRVTATATGGAAVLDAGTTGGESAVADSGAGGSGTSVGGSAGGSSIGGSAAGGVSSVGGQNAGGTSATGASSVAGDTSMGGATNAGGTSSSSGPSSTGGVATGGTSAGLTCVASGVAPTDKQALANADDLNGTCSDGIQYNVVVATNAPDGTAAALSLTLGSGNTAQVASTTVSSAAARFANVTLPASGQVTLTAAIGGNACSATETLTLSCEGAPGCTITSPTITTAHPALNGVAATQGDRVSSIGSPYQVAFEVSTDAQDGQSVVLTVDGSTNYQTTVSAGKARFAGVLMASDGNHTAQAVCTARSGLSSTTSLLTFPVDTAVPDLTPQKGTGTSGSTISTLNNSDHYALADDADLGADGLQIRVCGASNATDAVDIASANPNANNFCVKRGSSASVCAAVLSTNSNASGHFACVNIDCPGAGPFSLDLSMSDAAGNPTTVTRTGITCASTSPTVNIIDPQSDSGTFSDVSKRILAADNNNAQTVRKDKNIDKAGAQYDVFACTTAQLGSTAILYTGYKGQTLNQTATATVTADSTTTPVCSGGNLITFSSSTVTLPESLTNSSFNILTPTELKVSVTDLNLAVGSDTADVWVDSVSPSLTLVTPSPFCGQYFDTSGTGNTFAAVSMKFGSSLPVVVSVAGTSGTQTFSNSSVVFSQVTVGVQLEAGTDTVSARAAKPSTNYGTYPACDVTVGNTPPPSVSWQTPVNSSLLTSTGNTGSNKIPDNNATTGWQGTLKVCTNIDVATYSSATVTFTATVGTSVTTIGSANIVADGSCPAGTTSSATLAGATVPEGGNVLLTATTSTIGASTGMASVTVPVSSTLPGQAAITGVDITDRRRASFTPKWTAPSGAVAGYKIRVSTNPIATQSDFDNARDIGYSGSGSCPTGGCSVLVDKCHTNIDNCYIENGYYFAVAPVDSVGNMGIFVATSAPTVAHFVQTDIRAQNSGGAFGAALDASGDLNGDNISDLIASYAFGSEVDIFLGPMPAVAPAPSVRIIGSATQFGYTVAAIGDVNKDGYGDLAIGSGRDGNGKAYIFFGRSKLAWASTPILHDVDADVTLSPNTSADAGYSTSAFGASIARLGDYNGDAIDDFAIGAFHYGNGNGQVIVVLGSTSLPKDISFPEAINSGAASAINGASAGWFGYAIVGLGKMQGLFSTPGLGVVEVWTATTGKIYSFTGTTGSSLASSAAVSVYTGAAGEYVGKYGLMPLGNVGPSSQFAFGVSMGDVNPVRVDLWSATSGQGAFSVRSKYTSSESATNAFGRSVTGGGVSGTADTFSFVGPKGGRSDVAITTLASGKPRLFLIDGDQISMPSSGTVEYPTSCVTVNLEPTFINFSRYVTAGLDIDGDGYGDPIVAEYDYANTTFDGHVLVLH